MNLTTVTGPRFEPVWLDDVHSHLRLDVDGSPPSHPDDAMLEEHIVTARRWVEHETRRSLVEQTLRLSMPGFTTNTGLTGIGATGVREIRLLRPPVIAVESVSYYDDTNTLQPVDPASYYVTDEAVPELRFVTGFSAPAVYDRPDAVRVIYRAGHATESSPLEANAADVPAQLRSAILVGVQLLYDDLLEKERVALENAREMLVSQLRIALVG